MLKYIASISFIVLFCFTLLHSFTRVSYAQTNTRETKEQSLRYADLLTDLSLQDRGTLSQQQNGLSAARRIAASIRKKLQKKNFRADEKISITFNNPANDKLSVQVINAADIHTVTPVEQMTTDGITEISVIPSNEIKPGKYTLIVTGMNGKLLQQDFTWGVLAINTNKSYYKPGEKAHLEFAVLNNQGNMVCDAKLNLQISNDQLGVNDFLSSENGDITVNPECYSHNFTLKPDYEAEYTVRDEGTYIMTLTAETANGSYTIVDTLIVDGSVPFDIERITATRIYPPNSYPVIFKITAKQDFEGKIKEAVPGSFSSSPFSVSTQTITRDTYITGIKPAEEETPKEEETSEPQTDNEQPIEEQQPEEQPNTTENTASPSADTPVATSSAYSLQNDPLLGELKTLIGQLQIALEMPFTGSYPITQRFGVQETDPLLLTQYVKYGVVGHDGIDFALPRGTPVLAADTGTVIYGDYGDYGKTVIIQHSWGRSYYGHLDDVHVSIGAEVKKGEKLGLSGNTGLSTGPHLHFGIKPSVFNDHNGYFGKVDPLIYINNDVTRAVAGTTTAAGNTGGMMQVTSLEYPIKLKKGETIQVEYRYLAPQKSPESYLLGPLQLFDAKDQLVFEESRQWQIASDAVWYSANWEFRKAITIDRGKVDGTGTPALPHLNFPVLIVATADADLVNNAQADGDDILFTSDDGSTKLSADKDATASAGTIRYWVQIPSLNNSLNTTIYMYYGNPSSCDQTATSCDASKNSDTTWDSNYVAVYHLEQAASTAIRQWDSSGNGHHMTQGGVSGSESIDARIGKGIDFDGSADYLHHVDDPAFDPATQLTISMWVRVDAFSGSYQYLMHHLNTSGAYYSYRLYYPVGSEQGDPYINYTATGSSGCPSNDCYADGITSNVLNSTYKYLAFSKTSTSSNKFYMNGVDTTRNTFTTTGNLTGANNRLCIAAECTGPSSQATFHNGVLDEVRIASIGRSQGWLKTEWSNQNSPGAFYTWGPQECMTPPATEKQMRHGKYFDACGRGAFSW